MNEQDYMTAWKLFQRGWSLAQIERHFGVGHRTVAKGFQRRGWRLYSHEAATVAETSKRQPSTSAGSINRWSVEQKVIAEFLAEKGRPVEFIAEVVNQSPSAVKELLAA